MINISFRLIFTLEFYQFPGAIFGTICGVSMALGVASTFEGGLNDFLKNTVENLSVIAGAGTSIGR